MKSSEKIPKRSPVTSPEISRIGAIYFVLAPKRKNRARVIWAIVLARDPVRLIPIVLILANCRSLVNSLSVLFNNEYNAIIAIADENEPAAENKKMYEKRVPEIIPCAVILKAAKSKTFLLGSRKRARITGKFERPRRRNGNGFGIAFSIVERKRQRAARKGTSFSSVCLYFII